MPIMRTEYQRIRELRSAKGLTQEELARAVGVSLLAVGRWERGQSNATPENLLRVAEVLGVEPEELGYELPSPMARDEPPQWFVDFQIKHMQRLDEINDKLDALLAR